MSGEEFKYTYPKEVQAIIDESSQGQFKPGDTVWPNQYYTSPLPSDPRMIVIASEGGDVWLKWFAPPHCRFVLREGWITATDPNQPAETVPRACPFCGGEAVVVGEEQQAIDPRYPFVMVQCSMQAECGLDGPFRKIRLEAVQAWNSILVRKAP